MQPKLVIAFDTLSEADFQAKVEHILSSLTNNPTTPNLGRNPSRPWPNSMKRIGFIWMPTMPV
jgi:hypothetical protein